MTHEYSISVGELTDFCHRSGDIDARFSPSPTGPEGIAGHQRIYKRRAGCYQSEYAVEHRSEFDQFTIALKGRADGFDPTAGLVEEIKTCRVPAANIPEPISKRHMAQGKLYAAAIAVALDLPNLTVRLTWLNIDTDQEYPLEQSFSRAELDTFLNLSLTQLYQWLRGVHALNTQRNQSVGALDFPYGEFRHGQRDIAELVYKCVDQQGQLLVEAPTGIGKTAAVLYPALKALAQDKHDKIIFTTAKNVGRLAAENTLEHFRQAGMSGQALSLTAKDRVCFSPGKACHGDDCPFARGYYDKLPAAMAAAQQHPTLRREEVESLAREFEVCPYELAKDLLPWVDILIADLHYVYSLYGSLGSTMENDTKRWSILLDEAHNLPDRARGMYSARLAKASLMQAKREAPKSIAKALDRINREMLSLQNADVSAWNEAEFTSMSDIPERLLSVLNEFAAATSESLSDEPAFLLRHPELMDFFFDALHFLRVAELWGPEYRFQLQRSTAKSSRAKQSLKMTLTCLDPARLLASYNKRAHSVTAFSATLTPTQWMRQSLGLSEKAVCTRSPSPFQAEQLHVTINSRIDTRFSQRQDSLPALSQAIAQWLDSVSGNCIVYFPSYRYRDDCLALMAGQLGTRERWLQEPQQTDTDRNALFDLLRTKSNMAAFCILGGIWGEGVDLPGDQLASVVIVGVGMPQVNRDTRELQSWYEASTGSGFEYTFVYPGMQKVAQAIGRVIRALNDRGSALLIDTRYGQRQYRELLPPWWQYTPLSGPSPSVSPVAEGHLSQ